MAAPSTRRSPVGRRTRLGVSGEHAGRIGISGHTQGRNFITVRGFTLRHAATPWAPPTAEQIGLIGTHWSKGWIIENNVISHSRCSGVTLGKYGDQWDNTSANTAEGYVKTIERALANGWNKEAIGHHVIRNNTIHDCEQTGICGSLGAVFSQITGNHIHNIWAQRLFAGAEMAGIKIHASIDMLIQRNRIHNAGGGIWMDWMAQGTHITGNEQNLVEEAMRRAGGNQSIAALSLGITRQALNKRLRKDKDSNFNYQNKEVQP